MSYLVDTRVPSKLRRKSPHRAVRTWFAERPAATLYLSVLTLGEIRKGIEAVAETDRRLKLISWLEADLPAFFTGRIPGIDAAVARRWGRRLAAAGRPLPAIYSLLATTAFEHDLVLVTRNVHDFAGLPVHPPDPWAPNAT